MIYSLNKNCLKCVIIACLSLVIFNSCENAEISRVSQPQEYILMQKLTQYNMNVAESQPQTRSFGRFCAIVGADFTGACEGASKGARIGFRLGMVIGGRGLEGAAIGGATMGLICGAGASYLADLETAGGTCDVDASIFINQGKKVRQEYYATYSENEDILLPDGLELPSDAISVGILHNEILDNLLEEEISLASLSPDLDSDDNIPELPDIELALFDSPEVSDTSDFLLTQLLINDFSIIEDDLAASVADSFLVLIQNYSPSIDNLITHINNYYRYISASDELTDAEKNGLYCGLAVAYYSYRYWITDYEQEAN
jgi:hypothetical protein